MIEHKIIELYITYNLLITFLYAIYLKKMYRSYQFFFLCITKQIEEVKTESRRASIIEKKVITEKVKKTFFTFLCCA